MDKVTRGRLIAEVLERECGMHASLADPIVDFVVNDGVTIASNAREFRFRGSLGMGGKLWHSIREDRYTVSCYAEDETPMRWAIMARTNSALASID